MSNNYILPGRYIVAVSGGVDSVVLLDLLSKNKDLELIVAHVDHGIREDSTKDSEFVASLAKEYNLKFEKTELNLGKDASEELAREERYKFLGQIKQKYQANAIITGHNQDDVIETAFINIVRGTGFWGLASLNSSPELIRPLLGLAKADIKDYALQNNLQWHEDSTNTDKTYLRNKIRLDVVANMTPVQRMQILTIIANANNLNFAINKELSLILRRGLHKGQLVLTRKWFNNLPHDISKEVTRRFLIDGGATNLDKKTIERIAVSLKTLPAGKTLQAPGVNITLTKRSARLKSNGKTDKKRL